MVLGAGDFMTLGAGAHARLQASRILCAWDLTTSSPTRSIPTSTARSGRSSSRSIRSSAKARLFG